MTKPLELPREEIIKGMIDRFCKELENGWSPYVAQRKAGISQKLDIILSTTNDEYRKIKINHNIGRKRIRYWSNDYMIEKIEIEKQKNESEKKRLLALEKATLPFGIGNFK